MTREQAIEFQREMIVMTGGDYHPDTPIKDYWDYRGNMPLFSEEQAAELEEKQNQCFEVLGDEIYEVGEDEDLDGDGFLYPGFSKALDEISSALDSLEIHDLYFDIQCEQLSRFEPEPCQDPETGEWIELFWEDFYHVDARMIKRALLGKELSTYL